MVVMSFPFPCQPKLGKSLQTRSVNFFRALKLTFCARKICILESIFFAKQELVTRARLHILDFTTGKNSLLISAVTKGFAFFLRKVNL